MNKLLTTLIAVVATGALSAAAFAADAPTEKPAVAHHTMKHHVRHHRHHKHHHHTHHSAHASAAGNAIAK